VAQRNTALITYTFTYLQNVIEHEDPKRSAQENLNYSKKSNTKNNTSAKPTENKTHIPESPLAKQNRNLKKHISHGITSHLLLCRGGLRGRDELLELWHTIPPLLQQTLLSLALTNLNHVVLPLTAGLIGIDCQLVTLFANLYTGVGTERHLDRVTNPYKTKKNRFSSTKTPKNTQQTKKGAKRHEKRRERGQKDGEKERIELNLESLQRLGR
jgi:hypothetical protein